MSDKKSVAPSSQRIVACLGWHRIMVSKSKIGANQAPIPSSVFLPVGLADFVVRTL